MDTRAPEPGQGTARRRFAERLQELQAATGKSLKELERIVHTSDSSLSRYLAGQTLPPWEVAERLCEAADAKPGPLKTLWEQARKERGTGQIPVAPEEPERWWAGHPRVVLATAFGVTAVVFAVLGVWAGASWFPHTVTVVQARSTSDAACKDWPWPPQGGAGETVEPSARPLATDHQPVVSLNRGMIGGHDSIWAQLTGAIYGDRVWMDVSDNNAATWAQCGPFLATGDVAVSRAHDLDPKLKFRACADTTHHKPTDPANSCTTFW